MSEIRDRNQTKKWLILAHCFNMDGRASSHTITDRLPFLMESKVFPIVISAPIGTKDFRFPHYQVISPAPSGILFEMRHIVRINFQNIFIQKFLKILFTLLCLPFYILEKLFIHFDSHWSWFLGASVKGYFLIKKYRPGLIYSTAGPYSTHVAGYILSKIFKIPWLAEFHDPLIYDNERRKWHNYLFKRWVEKKVCKDASAFIFFTEKALRSARQRNHFSKNGYVLRPGANPPDFSEIRYKKREKIHFSHFGSLSETRNLRVFIEALYKVLEKNPYWKNKVSLDIYGSQIDPVSKKYLSMFPLSGIARGHGRIEYDPETKKSGRQQIMEAMRQSDVLLIVHGEEKDVCEEYIPSKLYEYFLVKRPVMGIVDGNTELEMFLKQTSQSVSYQNDINGVAENIREFIERWEKEGLPDHKQDSSFTIQSAVKKLLTITENIKNMSGKSAGRREP
jgi:glycosyltransferase involved in cell wall biosynthesis